jgi:5-dehydro-2-deoxygluconokinase
VHSPPDARAFDTLHMGRCTLDLYSNDLGASFPEITSFSAYVGGSPANVCVGARRLGLRAAMLTAVGDDPVGDFALAFLEREGIDTRYASRKPGFRTGAALLAIQPPDRFPLVYYRDDPADLRLDLDDVAAAPIATARVLQLAGTNLSREPSRSATLAAAELARRAGTTVVLDLDFRADQWSDPRMFGIAVRSLLRLTDIVIGTDDEINAAVLRDRRGVAVAHSQVSEARIAGETERAVAELRALGPEVLIRKTGPDGSSVYTAEGPELVPGYPVEIRNVLGAGDAFAAGFLYGYLSGWDLARAARFGNACGALVVTRHGCSASMPTLAEVAAFVDEHGREPVTAR